ncbi:MAG: pantetheine-phosphate adenylyltransferase [Bacteroidota bacterium]
MKIAIYPGTFDPITNGHIDVLERAIEIFDKVIVTVARNSAKNPMFSDDERVEIIKKVVKRYGKKVEVDSFSGLLVDYAKAKHAVAIVRGLRAISDFEYEFQMALMNRKLSKGVFTLYLMPHERYTYLNSSIVREIASLGGDISNFVPKYVARRLLQKTGSKKGK